MFLLNLTTNILKILPFWAKKLIASLLALIAVLTPNRSNIVAKLQINKILNVSNNFILRFKVFRHFINETLNNLTLAKNLQNNFYTFSVNKIHLLEEFKDSNSKLIISAHTGNWELLASFISNEFAPVTAVGRSARNSNVQELLIKQREEANVHTIWRDDNASRESIRELISAFKSETVIAVLIDQDTRVDSTFVKFMGHDAKTPDSLCKLAKKYNSPIYSVFSAKKSAKHLYIEVEKFDSNLEVSEILAKHSLALDNFVRRFPEQWVWFHKRWRTQPESGHLSYKKYLEFLKN